MNRRGFLQGILAAGMAPAIVKAEILMPVRKIIVPAPIFIGGNLCGISIIGMDHVLDAQSFSNLAMKELTNRPLFIVHPSQYEEIMKGRP